jgi:RNA polymerase-binding protein DksA
MQKKPIKKNNRLTLADIKNFKAILVAKRNELLGNVSSMETEALRRESSDLSRLPIHMADVGTDNYDQEFTLGLMDSERKLIGEINDALNRIENGTYGICEGSGDPIPKQRLQAIPWTRYCVAYAKLLEKGLAAREEHLDEADSEDRADEEKNDNLHWAEQ